MKALVAVLLVANLAFWAWTAGWLDAVVGASPHGVREPQRLLRQVQPQRVRIVHGRTEGAPARTPSTPLATLALSEPAATAASAPVAGEVACYEAGPFTPTELVAAEAALVRAALPAGSWIDVRVERPGAWMLYVGRFATRELLAQRQDELRRRNLPFEEVRNTPDLEFGLSLGRFDDRVAADAALARLQQIGVRNARVLTVSAPNSAHLLRVERADLVLRSQLQALRAPVLGAGFVRCGQGAAR